MMMQNLFHDLEQLLATNEALIDGSGHLIKNAVIDRATRLDADFLQTLLSSDPIRAHFFADVGGTLVFDKVKFAEFVSNKAFLPDSYTAFRNRIGLTDGQGRYLKDSRDVVLAWPYKDCVLEGGMTKEDARRDELFWNTTLAPDDITRLFEPKALTGFERWDADAVAAGKPKPVGTIGADDNLLIKGNNLLALHSLKARYAGQVKLIYIDPPYNTGGDGFKYNDRFNHAAWLTFMRNRLEVARRLLRPDGAIFISIDANELGYLLALGDEVFGRANFVGCVTVKRASLTGHKAINPGVVNVTEFLIAFAKDKQFWEPKKVLRKKDRDKRYSSFIFGPMDDPENWEFTTLLEAFAKSKGHSKGKLKKILGDQYDIELDRFVLDNAERVFQPATVDVDASGEAAVDLVGKSQGQPDKVFKLSRDSLSDMYFKAGKRLIFAIDRVIEVDGERAFGEVISDIWDDVLPNDLHNEGGVSFKKGKKPERFLERVCQINTEAGDLAMDFFVGSGSFAAVAHKCGLNWIAVEQMDYGQNSCVVRLKGVVSGEQSGISKSQNWQGGGSFVYLELAEWNEALGRRIREADDEQALGQVTADMRDNGYWRYAVDQALWDWDAFATLEFDQRKQALLDALDANHLYVNHGDIADAAYGISAADIAVNKAFYEGDR